MEALDARPHLRMPEAFKNASTHPIVVGYPEMGMGILRWVGHLEMGSGIRLECLHPEMGAGILRCQK